MTLRFNWRLLAMSISSGILVLGQVLVADPVRAYSVPTPELVSIDDANQPASGSPGAAQISGDGNRVAFLLTQYDPLSGNVAQRIYVRDRTAQTSTLVSILPDATVPSDVQFSAFSENGQRVVFVSASQMYVRDIATNTTRLVSIDENGQPLVTNNTYLGSISGDGTKVSFMSNSKKYIRDIDIGVTRQLLSPVAIGPYPAAFSYDGMLAAYTGSRQTYLYNWQTGLATAVSTYPDGSLGEGLSYGTVALSDDGRYVAFANTSNFLALQGGRTRIYRKDVVTGQIAGVDVKDDGSPSLTGSSDFRDSATLAISGDGAVVAFGSSNAGGYTPDVNKNNGLYARNFQTGHIGLVTADASGEPISGDFGVQGRLSYNGSLVAFLSDDPLLGGAFQAERAFVNLTTGTGKNFDSIAPVLGGFSWSANPRNVNQVSTLTVPVTDDVSGVATGEYFVDSDPGAGNASPMTFSGNSLSGTLSAQFASNGLTPGVYKLGVRTQDYAGNWSGVSYDYLVVVDQTVSQAFDGKNKKDLIPSLGAGDVLPGLVSTDQTDAVGYGFTVDYKNGVIDPKSDFAMSYNTGTKCGKAGAQNCHNLSLSATNVSWLILDQTNNSRGRFQGVGSLAVDGVTTTNPFTVTGIDGDRLTPSANDTLVVRVYAPGANSATATPIYQASGSMAKGNSVRVK